MASSNASKAQEKGRQSFTGGFQLGLGGSIKYQRGPLSLQAGAEIKGQGRSNAAGDMSASTTVLLGAAVNDYKFGILGGAERDFSTNDLNAGVGGYFGKETIFNLEPDGVGASRGSSSGSYSQSDIIVSVSVGTVVGVNVEMNVTRFGEALKETAQTAKHLYNAGTSYILSGFKNPFD